MANHGPSEAAPSAKQLVFLAMVATVVAVIVFLCGVLVGRGLPARRAIGPTATDVALSGGGGVTGFGIPDIALAPGAEPVSPLDNLSYFDLLNSTDVAPEAQPAPADTPAEESAFESREPSPSGPLADGTADAAVPVATLPVPSRAAAAASFVVQVTALRSRDEARSVAAGLVAKGYPAFVVDPTPGAPVAVFRVRVGPYPDLGAAEPVRDRLETEEQFKPFLMRP